MNTSFESVVNTTAAYVTKNIIANRRNYVKQLDWIIPVVLCIIFFILVLWILLSLVHYGIKTGKWSSHPQRSSDKLNIGKIYTFVVITAFTCICFLIANMVYVNIGFNFGEDGLCDTVSDITLAIYFLKLCSIGMFLWLRQRVFYKNFMLNTDYSKTVRICSSSSIVVILLFGMAALVFNVLPNNHKSSPNGCIYNPSDEYKVWYWVAIVVVIVFGHLTLMGLFVYGLMKTSREKWIPRQLCCYGGEKDRPPIDVPLSSVESNKTNYHRSKIVNNKCLESKVRKSSTLLNILVRQAENQSIVVQRILWKTLIFAILSILGDIFLQVVIHYVIPSDSHRRISVTVANLNAILNVLFVLFSFENWKKIFTTFCDQ